MAKSPLNSSRTIANLETINILHSGIGGYFKVEDNIVKIEYINARDCGTRTLEFGKIVENGIEIYNQNPKTFFFEYVRKNSKSVNWKFVEIENIKDEIPDW